MSSTEEPEWLKDFKAKMDEAGEEIAKGLGSVFRTFAVSAAMGAMYKGDLDGARTQLDSLPDEQLQAVSVAASALASLAEEIAGERSRP